MADEAFGTIGPRWRQAVQRGEIEWEDYSNFAMVSRFPARWGCPLCRPAACWAATCWRRTLLSPEQRTADPRTASKKAHIMASPFDPDDQVVLLPAIHTEFTVLHVQKATPSRVIRIEGQNFADFEQALCAGVLIVTAEEIVLRRLFAWRRSVTEYLTLPCTTCVTCRSAHTRLQSTAITTTTLAAKALSRPPRTTATFQAYLDTYVYGVPIMRPT